MPTCTVNGCEVSDPVLTVSDSVPDCDANPLMVSDPLEYVVPSVVPFNFATDVGWKPEQLTVAEKMPRGSWPFEPTLLITGVGTLKVMVAVALPLGPVAVTVSLALA